MTRETLGEDHLFMGWCLGILSIVLCILQKSVVSRASVLRVLCKCYEAEAR
ncbi:MAG: hypothetical protein ACMG55_09815 [Microcoleus sp.]